MEYEKDRNDRLKDDVKEWNKLATLYKEAARKLLYIEEELYTFFRNVSLDADLMVKLDEMTEMAKLGVVEYLEWKNR